MDKMDKMSKMSKMSKMNLDILNYSAKELLEIFNIDHISNSKDIEFHLNNYRNNLFLDNSLGYEDKNNITDFLNQSLDKITNHLNKNTLIKGTPLDHPIIENPNTIAGEHAESYKGRNVDGRGYPPGYINPINIKTIKKTVNMDTRFRDPYYNTKSTDFIVSLPEQFKKVVNMRVSSIQIPLCVYSISKSLANRNIVIDSSNIVLKEGNYKSACDSHENTDCPYIQTIIDELIGTDISFTIDPASQKSIFEKISGPVPSIIKFNVDEDGATDLSVPLPLKLGWLLGFRAGEYQLDTIGSTIESEGICSIMGPKYIYLCINDYTNAANNYFVAAFTSSTISPYIISRINYHGLVQSESAYRIGEENLELHNRTREYFGPVDIQKLHFQILDEYGRVIDLNNMDWSCTLTFDIMYD